MNRDNWCSRLRAHGTTSGSQLVAPRTEPLSQCSPFKHVAPATAVGFLLRAPNNSHLLRARINPVYGALTHQERVARAVGDRRHAVYFRSLEGRGL